MRVASLTVKNYRGFREAEVPFSNAVTLLVGVNGSGKSSVLDALAMLLSWSGKRIRGDETDAWSLSDSDIFDAAPGAVIGLEVDYGDSRFTWDLSISRPEHKTKPDESSSSSFNQFVAQLRQPLSESNAVVSYPIMVYYPANRAVTQVPVPPPKDGKCFEALEIYRHNLSYGTTDFEAFFEWFRAREDLENESRLRSDANGRDLDRDMVAVRSAIQAFLPEFTNLRVTRLDSALVADKHGQTVRVDRLSDGEKFLIAMVGDVARRLSLANPGLPDPLVGQGVVLIDEIEQHLHPAWQRSVIPNLLQIFPQCQFIVSTHSPQVIGEVAHEDIRLFQVGEDGGLVVSEPSQSLGLDTNLILEEVMGAPARNLGVKDRLIRIFRDIDQEDGDALARARQEIGRLRDDLDGDIPELVEAEAMLSMLDSE